MEKVVCFDLDGTIIEGQSQEIMLKRLWQEHQISSKNFWPIIFWFLLYKIGLKNDVTFVMQKAYSLVQGMPVAKFNALVQKIVAQDVKKHFFPIALYTIKKYHNQEYQVGIISTAIDPLIQIFVQELKLDFGIGTQLEQKSGVFTGKIKGQILYHSQKAIVLQKLASEKGWDLFRSYAFSDSYSDLPLLQNVGHPVVINPDRRLRRQATLSHWPIYNWKVE